MGARAYDPRTARWLQRERVALLDGHPNPYLFAQNDPLNNIDPNGFTTNRKDYPGGHHIVPRQVFKSVGLPEDTLQVLRNATTGYIKPGHKYDKLHAAYNTAVEEMWDKWIKTCGIDPSKMTPEQALHFVMKVMRSGDPRISNFLKSIAEKQGVSTVQMKFNVLFNIFSEGEWARILKEGLALTDSKTFARLQKVAQKILQNKVFRRLAARVLGRAAGKANVLVTIGLFVVTAFQQGIITACNEALWPLSELWTPGTIRLLLGE